MRTQEIRLNYTEYLKQNQYYISSYAAQIQSLLILEIKI